MIDRCSFPIIRNQLTQVVIKEKTALVEKERKLDHTYLVRTNMYGLLFVIHAK
ncbi:hypothetical protein JOC74_002451 [Bacillus capparidis]|uniref:Uncharacterized protein n=1 Tax=Bacillus capparidis TaxID=1840411 RepID=A0ABS4CXF4_9BACI|nr:hypothetical protein [Bacillus capparidis]